MKFFLETRVNQRLGVYLGSFIYKNFALSTPPDWNHVLVTFDGTQAVDTDKVKLYVNGSEVTGLIGSTSLTSLPAGLTKIYIGIYTR